MNFSFYFLGTPDGRYSQYPDDYTASTLAGLQEGMVGARLLIYRDMDLMHYAYTERLGNNNIIGFCLIFNQVRIQKPRQLIKLFRFIIEKRLVESGEVIKYTEDGELRFGVKAMNECVKEYDRLKGFLNSEFENNASKYDVVPLTTTYNGIRSAGELGRNASDSQIVAMTSKHNKVIINEDEGIEHGYIPQIISSLREQNHNANEEIARLIEENASLEKKKKQYSFVILLALIILGCGVGLFFLNDNLNLTKDELMLANETITNKDIEISELYLRNDELNTCYQVEKQKRSEVENQLERLHNNISDRQPFIIKKTSFEFSTGYLTVHYYGITEGNVDIQVRAYKSGESYSNTASIYVYKGDNVATIYLSSMLDGSKWYSFEVLQGNVIIGGSRH